MTGLMTPDRGKRYASDTIQQVQHRLTKSYTSAPRRTALFVFLGVLKALLLVSWLVSRQQPKSVSAVPTDIQQAQEVRKAIAPLASLHAAFSGKDAGARNQSFENIQNDILWRDTEGNVIQAHGGSVLFHEGVYHLYGEHKGGRTLPPGSGKPPSIVHRVDVIGVSCYTSTDLINWKYEGLALPAGQHSDLDPSKVVERPRVLYHEPTQRFVMWMHIDTGDYELARCGMATSPSATGPYRYLRSFRPHAQMCRDFTVFKDDDGEAYIAYSSERNKVMHVARLTQGYTNVAMTFTRTMVGLSREAPAIFKHRDIYLMITSGCTGWQVNRAEVYFARDPLGEWESLGSPCVSRSHMLRETTFYSQGTHVLPMPGQPGRYVFMADRWLPQALGMSRYIWLPLWVVDIPQAVESPLRGAVHAQQRSIKRNKFRSMRPGPTNMQSLPPVDVVVRWQQRWNLTVLDAPPPLCADLLRSQSEAVLRDGECAI